MTPKGWYWCFTHDRVESSDERDDPDNALGPYDTAEAAADWRTKSEQRAEDWAEAEKEWSGDDDAPDGGEAPAP